MHQNSNLPSCLHFGILQCLMSAVQNMGLPEKLLHAALPLGFRGTIAGDLESLKTTPGHLGKAVISPLEALSKEPEFTQLSQLPISWGLNHYANIRALALKMKGPRFSKHKIFFLETSARFWKVLLNFSPKISVAQSSPRQLVIKKNNRLYQIAGF